MNARLALEQILRDEEQRADEAREELTCATIAPARFVRVRPMLPPLAKHPKALTKVDEKGR